MKIRHTIHRLTKTDKCVWMNKTQPSGKYLQNWEYPITNKLSALRNPDLLQCQLSVSYPNTDGAQH